MQKEDIRGLRRVLGLTQAEFAGLLGCTSTTVARWERGASRPSPVFVRQMAKLADESLSGPHRKLVAVELFAGGGGLSEGLRAAGFDVALATDVLPAAEATFRRNWPDTRFHLGDVRELTSDVIRETLCGRRLDLLTGGPPCQGFSTIGSKISADPRNLLFEHFARLAEELQPRAVLIENVKAITTMYGGRFREYILDRFAAIGYPLEWVVLDAASYGTPQHRQRAFFVGYRDAAAFKWPEPSHGEGAKPFVTAWDAIADLEFMGSEVPNHLALSHSERVVARYRLIPEGGRLPDADKLPEDIRRGNFGNTYKRLSRSKPALTMVPGNNAFPIHPTLDRSLTPREAARLQGFGDEIVFSGDRRTSCILIGNAVPPRLAAAVAKEIVRALKSQAVGDLPTQARPPIRATIPAKRDWLGIGGLGKKPSEQGFVDLFSGAGGFTIGFARAGLRPLAAADWNENVQKTHEFNYPSVPYVHGDLSDPDVRGQLLRTLENGGRPFAVVGGPPCQGFSVFGKRRFRNSQGHDPMKDGRNDLVFTFVDIAEEIQPLWVVMENVAGFATLADGWYVRSVVSRLEKAGYDNVEWRILNAAQYGVPQQRKRFVLIANRGGYAIPWPKQQFFAEPRDWQKPFVTVGDAISDLASDSSYSRYQNHVPMKHKPLLVERLRYIPEGGRLDVEALPPELLVGYRTDRVRNFSHVWKRLDRKKPAGTVVPGHNALPIHPWLDRALTVREAARLQTFPDDLVFQGSRQEQCIQAGNGFPPMLAQRLADNLVKATKNNWTRDTMPSDARYRLVDVEDAG